MTPPTGRPGAVNPLTVNLFTGDLSFSLDLMPLPGRGSVMGEGVSIQYDSNIRNTVRTWNREAPTGVLGLGWSLPKKAVIRNTNGTGNTDDDSYSIVDGANVLPLIPAGQVSFSSGAALTFQSRALRAWRISYFSSTETWEIIDENGLRSLYGGGISTTTVIPTSRGNSIEWGVRWGDWIGVSAQRSQQALLPVVWNMSRRENVWGEGVDYEYVQEQLPAGRPQDGGLAYTQASYLGRMVASDGSSLVFSYGKKENTPTFAEYVDPHLSTAAAVTPYRSLDIGGLLSSSGWWDTDGSGPDPVIQVMVTGENGFKYEFNSAEKVDAWSVPFSFTVPNVPPVVNIKVYIEDMDSDRTGSFDLMIDKKFSSIGLGSDGHTLTLTDKESHYYGSQHSRLSLALTTHVSSAAPKAYQDRYETRYFSGVSALGPDSQALYSARMRYQMLGTGEMCKRVLTGVEYVNSDGSAYAPPYGFSYWQESDGVTVTRESDAGRFSPVNGALYGALKSFVDPQGASTTYHYGQQAIPSAQRNLAVGQPDGDPSWNTPRIYWGQNYAVVLWANKNGSRPYRAMLYEWTGRWGVQDLGLIGSGSDSESTINVQTGAESFFISHHERGLFSSDGALYAFHRAPHRSPGWVGGELSVGADGGAGLLVQIMDQGAGVLTDSGLLSICQWTGSTWTVTPVDFSSWAGSGCKYALSAKRNWIAVAMSSGTAANGYFYLTRYQNGAWNPSWVTLPAGKFLPADKNWIENNGWDLESYAGDNFVLLRVHYEYAAVSGNYEGFRYFPVAWGGGMNSWTLQDLAYFQLNAGVFPSAFIVDDAVQIAADSRQYRATTWAPGPLDQGGYAFRYDGTQWFRQSFKNDSANIMYAADLLSTTNVENGQTTTTFFEYDPAAGWWGDTGMRFVQTLPHDWRFAVDVIAIVISLFLTMVTFGEGAIVMLAVMADVAVQIGQVGLDLWLGANLGVDPLVTGFDNSMLAGNNTLYMRVQDGVWAKYAQPLVPDASTLYHNRPVISRDLIAFMTLLSDQYQAAVQFVRNGVFQERRSLAPGYSIDPTFPDTETSIIQPTVANGMMVSYPMVGGEPCKLSNVTSFVLSRTMEGDVQGPLTDDYVAVAEVSDGQTTTRMAYEFDPRTAGFDPTGTTAQYYKVTVGPGADNGRDLSQGWTEFYFLNGVVSSTGMPDLRPGTVQLSSPSQPPFDVTYANLPSVSGTPFLTRVYSAPRSGDAFSVVDEVRETYAIFESTNPLIGWPIYGLRKIGEAHLLDGVTTMSTFSYGSDGLLRGEQFGNVDGSNVAEIVVTTYTRAADVYASLFGDSYFPGAVVRTDTGVLRDGVFYPRGSRIQTWRLWQETGRWGPSDIYEARRPDPGFFRWANGKPVIPAAWNKLESVVWRESHTGRPVERRNADGLDESFVYDIQHRFPAIASFQNASIRRAQAGYIGFEDYESTATWRFAGGVSASPRKGKIRMPLGAAPMPAHMGRASLTGSGAIFVQPSTFSPRSGVSYVFSAWVRPDNGGTCSVTFGNKNSTDTRENTWSYLAVISSSPAGNIPMASCTSGAIDDVRFGPTDAPFQADAFDPVRLLPTAHMDRNGATYRTTYNNKDEPALSVGPDEIVTSLAMVSHDVPSARWSVQSREGGRILPAVSLLSGSTHTASMGVVPSSGAVYAQMVPSPAGLAAGDVVSMSVGSSQVRYEQGAGQGSLQLYQLGVATGPVVSVTSMPREWLFWARSNMVHFVGDGRDLLLAHSTSGAAGELVFSLSAATTTKIRIEPAAIMAAAMPSVIYADGLGRPVQYQVPDETGANLIFSETLYDGWGNPAIQTRRAVMPAASPGYQPGLSAFDWASGTLSGAVPAYWRQNPAMNQAAADPAYAFHRRLYENGPLARLVEEAEPGAGYAIGTNQAMRTDSSLNDEVQELAQFMGLDSAGYPALTDSIPDANEGRTTRISLSDRRGRGVVHQTLYDKYMSLTAYRHNYRDTGSTEESVLAPNYFHPRAGSQSAAFVSTVTFNFLGMASKTRDVDQGETKNIYDRMGRPRFILDADGAGRTPDRIIYSKYDRLGRITETGWFDEDWNEMVLQSRADYDPGWPGATVPAGYGPMAPTIKWTFSPSPDQTLLSPVVGPNGRIYCVSEGASLFALDPRNGEKIWSRYLGGDVGAPPVLGPDGILYVLTSSQLFALSPDQGTIISSVAAPSFPRTSPAVAKNGRVYVAGNDGYLHVFRDGELIQKISLGGDGTSPLGSPSVASDGTAYVLVYQQDPVGGYVISSAGMSKAVPYGGMIPSQLPPGAPLVTQGGDVIVGITNGLNIPDSGGTYAAVAFSAFKGQALFTYPEDWGGSPSVAAFSPFAQDKAGNVYVGYSGEGSQAQGAPVGGVFSLQGFEANPTNNNIYAGLAADDAGHIYGADMHGNLFGLNTADGSMLWEPAHALYFPVNQAPVLGPDGSLYVSGGAPDGSAGWLYAIGASSPAATDWRARYRYDADEDQSTRNSLGRLRSVHFHQDEGDVIERYEYDAAGRPTVFRQTVGAYTAGVATQTIRYQYDAIGNITEIQYPALSSSVEPVAYGYDATGRVSSIGTAASRTAFATYLYDIDGRVVRSVLNSGAVTRAQAYDFQGRKVDGVDVTAAGPLFHEQLTFSPVPGQYGDGHVAGLTLTGSGVAHPRNMQYRYDGLGRLVSVYVSPISASRAGPPPSLLGTVFQAGFTYDSNGNILSILPGAHGSFSYGTGGNRLTSTPEGSYQYDADGRPLQEAGGISFEWDPVTGRILNLSDNMTGTAYLYGSRKVFELFALPGNEPPVQTLYAHGTHGRPLAVEKNGQNTHNFIFGPTGLAAIVVAGSTYAVTTDYLGSLRVISDAQGDVVTTVDYDTLGVPSVSSQSDVTAGFYFAGMEYDAQSGFYIDGMRVYDPSIGRFLTPDPEHQFASPYVYAGDNPVNNIDPTGSIGEAVIGRILTEGIEGAEAAAMAGSAAARMERGVATAGDALPELAATREAEAALPELAAEDACFSFLPGTAVRMAEGERSIEAIRPGDLVLGYDEKAGVVSPRRVEQVFQHDASRILEVTAGGATLRVTPEHPFFVVKRGWVKAGELRVGDALRSLDGAEARVEGIAAPIQGHFSVHNLAIEGAHTFFASDFPVLVHNINCPMETEGQIVSKKSKGPNARLTQIRARLKRRYLRTGTGTTKTTRSFSQKYKPYDAGHPVAKNLGGPGHLTDFIIPQNPTVNRGAFRVFESKVYSLVQAKKVQGISKVYYTIKPIYNKGNLTNVPDRIETVLEYMQQGQKGKQIVSFNN